MKAPTIPVQIAVGDFVQATKIDVTPGDDIPDNVIVATFTATKVYADGSVDGNPVLGKLKPADGWTVELVTKAPENIALPDTIAEIAAFSRTNEVLHLMGKGDAWQEFGTGRTVGTDMIQGWREWEPYAAEVEAYRAEQAQQTGTGGPVEGLIR